ncbi:MAG: hypothetical protein JWO06_3388, partial [Bacteroidota bacterium]|nr:hypothetical protein [Bacteroidota bacterium]
MKRILYVALGFALLQSCNNHHSETAKAKGLGNKDFEQYKNRFVEDLWKMYPGWAGGVGYHKYDSLLPIPNDAERQHELKFAQSVNDSLNQFNFDSLDANNKTDYKLIANFTEGVRFSINEFKSYEWDPSGYNIGEALFNVIDYKKMPVEDKLRNLSKKLAAVPAYYEAAKKNIKKPTKEHTELAITQNKGSVYFFEKVFPDSLKTSKLSESEVAEFNRNSDAAKKAVLDYVSWLQKDVLAKLDSTNSSSFRIGKALYAKKFKLDIDSRYAASEMYKIAVDRKAFLHNEMNTITNQLWSKYFKGQAAPADTLEKIRMMIDKISTQHCKREDFMQTVEKQLPELTAFINTHHLLDLDSTKPLKIRKTPDYAAGVAGAGINWPGVYDKDATTYYNVTPLTNYTAEKAESYLREYNNYVLQILNIHEAIPGHYTQHIYANRQPSIIKNILGNGAMEEGWACYVERMMIEQGYNASPEMQLFYDKWNLREACNFLLDYNIHCNNWTEKQVMDLIVKEAFQQSAEAKEKWNRATLTQV